MQCMAPGCAARDIASGAKAGQSMTSSRNLAVQRTPHICGQHSSTQYPVASTRATENLELRTGFLLYHFSVHALAERLLKTIRKQESIRAGDRLAGAGSRGADSVAFLRRPLDLLVQPGIPRA